jgi:thiamine-phosphate pyrophosphorylase
MRELMNLSLYVITDAVLSHNRAHVDVVRAALAGGASAIQLRDKSASGRQLVELGKALRELTRAAGALLIVNDRVDAAVAIGADGVHVGQDDLDAVDARRIIGTGKILGVSAATVAEALQAERDGADYIGAGAVYATNSKPDAGAPIGTDGLARVAGAVRIPTVAIGGINAANAAACIHAGAVGVAVISAVVSADDIAAAARRMREVIEAEKRRSVRA